MWLGLLTKPEKKYRMLPTNGAFLGGDYGIYEFGFDLSSSLQQQLGLQINK